MRIQTSKTEAALSQSQALPEVLHSQVLSYHEMAEVPVQEVNLFEQLEQNLAQVSDLQKRMSFVMREIRYLMKL